MAYYKAARAAGGEEEGGKEMGERKMNTGVDRKIRGQKNGGIRK
jgi:hypothetical protein